MERPPENLDDEILSIMGVSKEEPQKSALEKSSQEQNRRQPKVEENDDSERLQRAADYFVVKETSEAPARYTVFISLGLIIGAIPFLPHEAFFFFIFLMVSVLVIGLFVLFKPSTIGLLLQGIVLILTGICLIPIGIKLLATWHAAYENPVFPNERPELPWFVSPLILVGFCAIAWGIIHLFKSARYSNIPLKRPSDTDIDSVKKIANTIDSANPEASSSIIEFKVQTFWAKHIWKGMLSEHRAVFVTRGIEDIIFSAKEHFWITETGKAKSAVAEKVKVKVKLGTRTFDGNMYPVYLHRYKQWKESPKMVRIAQSTEIQDHAGIDMAEAVAANIILNPKTSRLAIASLVVGLFGMMPFSPFSIFGLILPILALKKIKKYPSKVKGRGIAIAGLVLSCIGIILSILSLLAFIMVSPQVYSSPHILN